VCVGLRQVPSARYHHASAMTLDHRWRQKAKDFSTLPTYTSKRSIPEGTPQFTSVLLFPLRERCSSENTALTALCSDIDPIDSPTCYLMLYCKALKGVCVLPYVTSWAAAGCNEVDPSGLLLGIPRLRGTVIFRVGLLKKHLCVREVAWSNITAKRC
jgi:hypothetical protein